MQGQNGEQAINRRWLFLSIGDLMGGLTWRKSLSRKSLPLECPVLIKKMARETEHCTSILQQEPRCSLSCQASRLITASFSLSTPPFKIRRNTPCIFQRGRKLWKIWLIWVLRIGRDHVGSREQHKGVSKAVSILVWVQMNADIFLPHRKVQTANSF